MQTNGASIFITATPQHLVVVLLPLLLFLEWSQTMVSGSANWKTTLQTLAAKGMSGCHPI